MPRRTDDVPATKKRPPPPGGGGEKGRGGGRGGRGGMPGVGMWGPSPRRWPPARESLGDLVPEGARLARVPGAERLDDFRPFGSAVGGCRVPRHLNSELC